MIGTCRQCGHVVDVVDGKVAGHGVCRGAGRKPRGELRT